MSSLRRIYSQKKLLGQVYTPRFVVEKMLADIGYEGADVLGKTVLDPACGDGRFLRVVVERIIALSAKEELKANLEQVYGWDIDTKAVEECRANLQTLIEPLGISVEWKIYACNSLHKIQDQTAQKFDFIVGNPPYIRIQHLSREERSFVQQNFSFCKNGSTDAYIAFYELCAALLSESGACALITPNTFFYSETGRALRAYFVENQCLRQLTNYGDIQLFDNATTYSAITIFDQRRRDSFLFEQAKNSRELEQRRIDFSEIQAQASWQLSSKIAETKTGKPLKELCSIHVGITTLCDKAYIFSVENIEEESPYVYAQTRLQGRVKIEKAILRPIIKASKLKSSQDPISEYVLFPYEKQANGKHKIIAESELQSRFPLAYTYLKSVKPQLDQRDAGKANAVAWYAFGRSQGLDTSFGKKILFSPMNQRPNFILVENENATFYSGYCIKYAGDYNFLLQQLNSQRLADFVASASRDFRGGWKAYNKKMLEQFTLSANS